MLFCHQLWLFKTVMQINPHCNWKKPHTESTTGLYWRGLMCEIYSTGTCLILSLPHVYISFLLLRNPWNRKQCNLLECTRNGCKCFWRDASSSQLCCTMSGEPQQQTPAIECIKFKNRLWRTKSLSSCWAHWEAALVPKHLNSFQELGSPISKKYTYLN